MQARPGLRSLPFERQVVVSLSRSIASSDPERDLSRPWPRTALAWMTVITLTVASISSYIDRQMLALLIAPIQHDLRLSDVDFGMLAGPAFVLLYVLMGVPLAWAADHLRRCGIIAGGISVWSGMTIACGLANSFAALFAARVGVAIGEAALAPAAYSLIADNFAPERRIKPTVIYAAGPYLGAGLAMLIGGALITLATSAGPVILPLVGQLKPWQLVFVLVGLPGVMIAAVLAFLPEPLRRGVVKHDEASTLPGFLRSRKHTFFGLTLGYSLFLIVPTSFLAWVPAFMMRVHGWHVSTVGTIYGLILLTCCPLGNYFGGWLADYQRTRGSRAPALQVSLIGVVGATPAAILMPRMPTAAGAVVMLVLACIFFGIPNGMPPIAFGAISPNHMRARIFAIYFAICSLIASGIGPVLVAAISQFILKDQSRIGDALSIVGLVTFPMSAIFFLLTFRPFLASLHASANWADSD
jgi:MFS family permease